MIQKKGEAELETEEGDRPTVVGLVYLTSEASAASCMQGGPMNVLKREE